MFSFFFSQLYDEPEIQQAFRTICLDKMGSDGYFDMSKYIYGRVKKEDMRGQLILQDSPCAVLYQNPYPNQDTAFAVWHLLMGKDDESKTPNLNLSYLEAEAIVNWIYRTLKNSGEREEFTKELLGNIKDLSAIRHQIAFSRGVVYNKETVELHFISSIAALNTLIASYRSSDRQLFYRGHANPNYTLLPSVFRTKNWRENERAMYHELIINCPEAFAACHTHLEKLVTMQHYGLPTRLLDITKNPLVALYFACEQEFDSYGEVLLLSQDSYAPRYPQSDMASMLASLPLFSPEMQQAFQDLALDPILDTAAFNERIPRLLHEVRLEKPAFRAEIKKEDLLGSCIVYALKNNQRIVKQDGAFILCGLLRERGQLNEFRHKHEGKTVVILIDRKKKMLEQLETFSIHYATLFPEIQCVSEYIKEKYS